MFSRQIGKRECVARAGLMLAACLATADPALAQEQVVWRQTLNTPKGANVPVGVKADILGVELGEPYAEARPKLQALLAESQPPHGMDDLTNTIRMQNAAVRVEATFNGEIHLRRRLKGSTAMPILERMTVHFSAPSSGNQVLGVTRTIEYDKSDEPRVSELVKRLAEKFGAQPHVMQISGNATEYRFQFFDRRAYQPAPGTEYSCINRHDPQTSADVRAMDSILKNCHVLMKLQVTHGLSPDHAKQLSFNLSDNERTKVNLTADYAFFASYLDELAKRSSGVVPKL